MLCFAAYQLKLIIFFGNKWNLIWIIGYFNLEYLNFYNKFVRLSMMNKKIESFFKKRSFQDGVESLETHPLGSSTSEAQVFPNGPTTSNAEDHSPIRPTKIPRVELEIDTSSVERDPGNRKPIWDYPVNRRDEIRHAYW